LKKSVNSPKLILSFDVELFFGKYAGTIDKCIIEPVEALLALAHRNGIRFTFFIDAGMLDFLWTKAEGDFLCRERDNISALIFRIAKEGHDIQLHVHPSWIDASWNGKWVFPTTHYGPASFVADEYATLFANYNRRLQEIAQVKTIAFRAGGFCLPPGEQLEQIFRREGIIIDSSLYAGGYEYSSTHSYDFRSIPHHSWWRFSESPLEPQENGDFYEVPVSSYFFKPVDFLKILATRRLGRGNLKAFGDGSSSTMSLKRKLTYLFFGAFAPASVDSGKSAWLSEYLSRASCIGNEVVHVMGHPKAISRTTISDMESFFGSMDLSFVLTLEEYASLNFHGSKLT